MGRMTMSPTLEENDLPWGNQRRAARRDEWQLVIAWSLDEPWRVGQSAVVREASVLGRGGPQSDDKLPRLVFHARRPGDAAPGPSLAAARVSRTQLKLTPTPDGKLDVTSVGKCALIVDGVETERAQVEAGAVLMLKNSLVLYVVHEPLPEALTACPAPTFAFGSPDASGIVGESRAAWRLRDELAMAANGTHHVLLLGESGAGKELAARSVHALSARAPRSFLARNAATFPEGLVDAELFGNAKNYPHAGSPERGGIVGEAEGGTLFLDEIGELPHALQGHLLRLLDRDGEYQRLGESRSRRADVRLVAATNRPLDALKHDLAARFSARVTIPTLGDRRADLPLLVRHILRRFGAETPALVSRLFDERADGPPEARVEPELIDALLRHSFTHHLRELERLLLLAVTTTRKPFVALTPEVLAELRLPTSESNGDPTIEAVRTAIDASQGNVTQAARRLGLKNRYLLYRLMKKYGLAAAGEEEDAP
jgi:two-component system nitrogen regulation response regulator GlnG/two-component system response regulator HydG